MVLVNYSESEGSDDEAQTQSVLSDSKQSIAKQSFQKKVDRSNPSKIKVSLPSIAPTALDEAPGVEDDRPIKRQKTSGGGLFSGLNSFLPAPKRSGDASNITPGNTGRKIGLGRGLGSGVSLKTGAAPGFSRSAPAPFEEDSIGQNASTVTNEAASTAITQLSAAHEPEPEVKLIGKATVFRPLSVARKNVKKKKVISTAPRKIEQDQTPADESTQDFPQQHQPKVREKVSLFSMAPKEDAVAEAAPSLELELASEDQEFEAIDEQHKQHEQSYSHQETQTLGSIASDLNLDEAERRQLFGRKGRGSDVPLNLVNFDTDREYNANEEMRAAGETVQHKALRTIQPGKHSLRQLVTAASTQKDALEESWAAGRRNKKEAGNKYGW